MDDMMIVISVEARQVVSTNGVRHIQLVFEDVIYSPEGCNLDQTDVVAATKEVGEPCVRESKGLAFIELEPA